MKKGSVRGGVESERRRRIGRSGREQVRMVNLSIELLLSSEWKTASSSKRYEMLFIANKFDK